MTCVISSVPTYFNPRQLCGLFSKCQCRGGVGGGGGVMQSPAAPWLSQSFAERNECVTRHDTKRSVYELKS